MATRTNKPKEPEQEGVFVQRAYREDGTLVTSVQLVGKVEPAAAYGIVAQAYASLKRDFEGTAD